MTETLEQQTIPAWGQNIENMLDIPITSGVSILALGEYSAGKTNFFSTFPNALFLDFDRGTLTARGTDTKRIRFGVSTGKNRELRVPTFQNTMDILTDIHQGALPEIEWIILDGFSELADILLMDIMYSFNRDPVKDKAQYDDYGLLKMQLMAITRLLGMIKESGRNVGATANVSFEKDEQTGNLIGVPEIVGKFRNKVPKKFDEVYFFNARLARTGEKGAVKGVMYEMYTTIYRNFILKTRLDLPASIQMPTYDRWLEASTVKDQ